MCAAGCEFEAYGGVGQEEVLGYSCGEYVGVGGVSAGGGFYLVDAFVELGVVEDVALFVVVGGADVEEYAVDGVSVGVCVCEGVGVGGGGGVEACGEGGVGGECGLDGEGGGVVGLVALAVVGH